MKYRYLPVIAGVFLAHSSWATIPLYENGDVLSYTIPGMPPPVIDAKVFYNHGSFSIDNNAFNPGTPFYETRNTLFYTNTGAMALNTAGFLSFPTGLLAFPSQNQALGFNFDLFTGTAHQWADTFYNPGTIHGVSTLDGNPSVFLIFFGNGFNDLQVKQLTAYGDIEVAATNIINPGIVEVSANGNIRMTGKDVDLTGCQLIQEPQLNIFGNAFLFGLFFGNFNNVNISGIGAVGVDTNADWNPGQDLTATSGFSSIVPVGPQRVILNNSQCYYDQRNPGPDYAINRYVFVENDNQSVGYNVYIDEPNILGPTGLNGGAAHVEWVGNYVDPATGDTINNYLYLNNDYTFGTATNDYLVNGIPLNFTFFTSPTPAFLNPKPVNFQPLPNVFFSNNYAVFFGNIAGSSVGTNVSYLNPHGTITNLPGKVLITASNRLNLAFANISGLNYLNLNAVHQFDGSPGASIAAPFSDISLGVTNGNMTVSNVLMAGIPTFNGTIDAFSSDWFVVDTTVTPNFTNEYKVLLVHSALQPTTPPYIKNLYLHGTNLLTISDPLNVFGSFFSDAVFLTLNTNQVGAGATSLDGELSWLNPLPFNANSGSGLQQMPNLLWVTNYGAIKVLETANFGNQNTPQFLLTGPAIPPVLARGILSETGTNVVLGDKVTLGTNVYTFVNTLVSGAANQVKWAALFDASMSNLIAAINGAAGSGTKYSTGTKTNKFAKAGPLVSHAVTVTALSTNASIGNSIATLFTPATARINLAWSGLTLMNGLDYIPPPKNYTSFNNHSLISDQGATIWTTYFDSDGTISNGPNGSFILHSGVAVFTNANPIITNATLFAGGDIVLMATNQPGMGFNSLIFSNTMIQAGRKLTLLSTNIDTGNTNANIWVVGFNSIGGSFDSGFNIPWKPPVGDLLGTTLTNIAPFNKDVFNVLSGHDFGISNNGFTNNLALGNMILDVLATNSKVAFTFSGATTNNALYVDLLELKDGATFGNTTNLYNFPWLQINPGMMIYYAQAIENGISVAENIDKQSKNGANNGRLRWVYTYAGAHSSTNIVYPDGSTNTINTPLAQSGSIDSDSDGTPNNLDPTPLFLPSELNFMANMTNLPPQMVRIQWTTIPNATNFVYFSTNMMTTNWLPYTNFNNWYFGNNVAVTNSAHVNHFHSPQVYINAMGPDNYQQTNVWVYDTITNVPPRYYKVSVSPWVTFPQ